MRALAFAILAIGLSACGPKVAQAPRAACAGDTAPAASSSCDLTLDGRTLRVGYGAMKEGVGGTVSIDVLGADGKPVQTLSETDVSEYSYPVVEDVDQDGKNDLLITRITGNVNAEQGVWRQQGDGKFVRVGQVSGTERTRMPDGLIAVPARSAANNWVVAFYRMDEAALTPIASVDTKAELSDSGEVGKTTCTLTDSPGIASLNLDAKAAEKKFCGEPAVTILFAE
jgi:hypothetical protein